MKIVKYCLALLPIVLAGAFIYSQLKPLSQLVVAKSDDTLVVNTAEPKYINEQELWTLIGNYKQENNLQVPIRDESLCTIAKMRLGVVANDWSHDGFEQNWKWNLVVFNHMSENLAKNHHNATAVITSWVNSPPHKKVLDEDNTHACIQCANINQTNYCVYISAI